MDSGPVSGTLVDTGELRSVAAGIRAAAEPLRGLDGGTVSCGDGRVDGALAGVVEAWSWVSGQAAGEITRVADQLEVAAKLYEVTEGALTGRFAGEGS